jgi:hypothetical protein
VGACSDHPLLSGDPFMTTVLSSCAVTALAVLGLATVGSPQDSGPSKRSRIESIVELSGLRTQIGQLVSLVKETIETSGDEARAKAAHSAYADGRIVSVLYSELERSLDEPDITAALDWLKSPLGLEITSLEVEPSGLEELLTSNSPPAPEAPKERLDLVTRLDLAGRGTETVVDIVLLADPTSVASTSDEGLRMALMAKYRQVAIRAALMKYRPLSTSDLSRYVEFAESVAGQRYSDAVHDAVVTAMAQAALEYRSELSKSEE